MSDKLDLSIRSLYDVKGKICLVTGGGVGIGRMYASALVQNGCRVYIASRKADVINRAAEEINAQHSKAAGGVCIPIVAGLKNKADCDALAKAIAEREPEGRLHVLVNNAGITWGAPLENFPEKQGWDDLLALNVKCIYYLTVACLPMLEKASRGNVDPSRVVNISSIAGVSVDEGNALGQSGTVVPSYPTSKAAVMHLTRNLSVILAKRGVTVNCVAPGLFESRMSGYAVKNAMGALIAAQPLGRIGSPEDMAGLILLLTSRAGAYLNGVTIPIDGGAGLGVTNKTPEFLASKKAGGAKL
ncbi:NAD(P)-binding protein [Gonapodya prolifera JEL478]|uniref:NAD(P)-binding protein n=1 Tax=Gonapodya prolifera (strain JEL478) TaxID=1344416 RepID=A0A139AYC8_GONPJ|nr:NAD(P)-binding protein [Gonapodya prolifera JEL478]|eukprot:KXS21729.1 NAD(P)-binding protein [Gonapodya prolifera JEL478]